MRLTSAATNRHSKNQGLKMAKKKLELGMRIIATLTSERNYSTRATHKKENNRGAGKERNEGQFRVVGAYHKIARRN